MLFCLGSKHYEYSFNISFGTRLLGYQHETLLLRSGHTRSLALYPHYSLFKIARDKQGHFDELSNGSPERDYLFPVTDDRFSYWT